MKITILHSGKIVLAALLIGSLLSGCSGLAPAQPTAVPTIDQQKLLEMAVQTLGAQMTADALANPSATPTPQPTATFTQTPTITPIPATPTLATPPTSTATLAPPLSAQALYAVDYPKYTQRYVPNEEFSLAIGYLNNGSITWEPGSKIKVIKCSGDCEVQLEADLGNRVGPGEKYEFNLWAFGSETLGKHTWTFQLFSAGGAAVPGSIISFYYESY